MSAVTASTEPLDITRVLRDVWAVLTRNYKTFFLLALILAGIPSALGALLTSGFAYSPYYGMHHMWAMGAGAPVGLIALVAGVVLQAALIYATTADMNGRQVGVNEALRIGLRDFLPLIGIGLVYGLAVMIGMILLVVPGVMIGLAWCVAAPAFVIERVPWMDAFQRSAELTRGNRWRILALAVVLLVIAMLVSVVVGIPMGILSMLGPPVAALFRGLISAVNAMVGAAIVAVLYIELRRLKDGVSPEDLASAFD